LESRCIGSMKETLGELVAEVTVFVWDYNHKRIRQDVPFLFAERYKLSEKLSEIRCCWRSFIRTCRS